VPFPDPDVPEVMVMKLALAAAVHAQLDVTGIDPAVPATLTSFVTGTPAVTGHGDEGALSLFEHAAAASAAVAATNEASNSRWYLIGRVLSLRRIALLTGRFGEATATG
jgi:hypothetical protein